MNFPFDCHFLQCFKRRRKESIDRLAVYFCHHDFIIREIQPQSRVSNQDEIKFILVVSQRGFGRFHHFSQSQIMSLLVFGEEIVDDGSVD